MKALLIADTHWLWYAAGRWGNAHGLSRPRVDYMSLRNRTSKFLMERYGNVYDLECWAFVVNRRQGSMNRFMDLLKGFGYHVQECEDPTPAIIRALRDMPWDLIVLAVGSVDTQAAGIDAADAEGRRIVLANFNGDVPPPQGKAWEGLALDGDVLYDVGQAANARR
jgi:hypothetical protein